MKKRSRSNRKQFLLIYEKRKNNKKQKLNSNQQINS